MACKKVEEDGDPKERWWHVTKVASLMFRMEERREGGHKSSVRIEDRVEGEKASNAKKPPFSVSSHSSDGNGERGRACWCVLNAKKPPSSALSPAGGSD